MVSAYDDGPSRERVIARVVCEADAREGRTWFDIAALGTGADAHRLCEATLRRLAGDPRCRVRHCADESLGPAPEVSANATILRHTTRADDLETLLDAVEHGRPPDEVTGQVHEHVVFATRAACITHAETMTRRAREGAERDARRWDQYQVERLEREMREPLEQLEALERRGGPVEDAHLRRRLGQTQKLIEALRSPAPPSVLESFTCFAPRSGQPALATAK